MISTPYKTLRAALDQPDTWNPTWAKHLEVRQLDGQTVYIAQPATINANELAELAALTRHGWTAHIEVAGLSKLRINMRRTTPEER